MALIDLIKRDKRARKLLKSLDAGSFKFDCDKYIQEIRQLHVTRRGREMSVTDVVQRFQTKMIDAVLHAQANRGRIVQIKMSAFKIHAKLDKHVGLVKQHLKSTYPTQLNARDGNASDRESILHTILEPAFNHIKDLKTVMDISDLAIKDLDQTGWDYKALIQIMEISSERKAPKM